MKKTVVLRELIEDKEILIMPVVHDALCARIAELVGFKAVFVGGYANSASLLGMPDVNLLTMTEMAGAAGRISDAVTIPVIADADTGYGDVINVMRTVRVFEKAGAAGIIIEDQAIPKRCGHMPGKEVIPVEKMVAKIRAATDARNDEEFVIVARTDALSACGLEEAIERARVYREEGADMTFIEAVETVDQMKTVISSVKGPHMANIIPGGRTPLLTAHELERIGYDVVAYPTINTYAVAKATLTVFKHLLANGHFTGIEHLIMDFDEFNSLVGLEGIRELERIYNRYGENRDNI